MERALANSAVAPDPASSWTWDTAPSWDQGNWASEAREVSPRRKSVGVPLSVVVLTMLAIVGGVFAASEHLAQARSEPTPTGSIADTDSGVAPAEPANETEKLDALTGNPAALPDETASPPVEPGAPKNVAWVAESASTLKELSRSWGIPQATLTQLNPKLSTQARIPAGTSVAVYARTGGAAVSVGAPNSGRLVRGVPMPDDPAWELARGRTRAFGTADTIENLTAALRAYAQRFPDAAPVELGDISARQGGKITSHQSHQSGRDADIMLVSALDDDASERRFSPARNWFLVKTLIDQGAVQAIYLNVSEQRWLKAAAVADVGAEAAAGYFQRIRHERGHDEHMHVRFACPEGQSRCINYAR